MPEAKRDEVPLPEPHGYVGACNQYCIQPKDSPLMWEKLNRWTADQLREHGRQCVQAALESTAAELARLQAECEALRKDAQRLQVLRSAYTSANFYPSDPDGLGLHGEVALIFCFDSSFGVSGNLDATLDSACAALSTSTAPSGAEE